MMELRKGMNGPTVQDGLVKVFLIIAASIVAFIIFNEIYFTATGKALIG